ncbi:hypothetical protein GQ457_07G040370 [Hibiscus cannabinus]
MLTKSNSDITSSVRLRSRSPKRQLYYIQSPSRDSQDGDKSSSMQATAVPWSLLLTLLTARCQILMGVLGFIVVFGLFCLIIWGACRPYKARIVVKILEENNIKNKLCFVRNMGLYCSFLMKKDVLFCRLTMNCSLRMTVNNPATFFGIHVSSNLVNLIYSEITVATGQELKKYYQPRKSHQTIAVSPWREVRSRGNVVGKLVKSRHRRRISCSLVIYSHSSKPLKLKNSSCQYE